MLDLQSPMGAFVRLVVLVVVVGVKVIVMLSQIDSLRASMLDIARLKVVIGQMLRVLFEALLLRYLPTLK